LLNRGQFLRRAAAAGIGLSSAGRALDAAAAYVVPGPRVHAYVTRPDLRPPIVSVLHHERGATADGLFFMAPLSGPGARGAMLVDDTGDIAYFHPTRPIVALNFRAAVYQGKPVLTWWEGKTEAGLGDGGHVILDETYRLVKRVPTGNRHHADLHEFMLTDRHTALVTAWELVEVPGGTAVNGIVQELELRSGRVLFEWKSLDHIDLTESHTSFDRNGRWDYFHLNSVERLVDGHYLVSARNTWGVYKVDGETGAVIWRLGGKRNDFAMGSGTGFAWQHDARLHPGNVLSLFDDGGNPRVQPQSKALMLHLDVKHMRATLHRRYVHHPPVEAHALGSTQVLPNGNVLVGWGTSPYFSEHTDGGRVVFDARLPEGGENYRVLRFPWAGKPYFPPVAKARRHAAGHLLYASWNGATEVEQWQLEIGRSTDTLAVERTVPKTYFETKIQVPAGVKYARATALDAAGRPLGRTRPVPLE
jgi:hypothetical protein